MNKLLLAAFALMFFMCGICVYWTVQMSDKLESTLDELTAAQKELRAADGWFVSQEARCEAQINDLVRISRDLVR